jgi:uncharacterized protein (DUF1800 family)
MRSNNVFPLKPLLLALCLGLVACGGGGGGGGSAAAAPEPVPAPAPSPEPTPEPPPAELTEFEAARFLSQATFGPDRASIDKVMAMGLEQWLLNEFQKSPSLHLESVLEEFPDDGDFRDDNGNPLPELVFLTSNSVWKRAIKGNDQLRQRMAFALSQILVVSVNSNLRQVPQTMAHYADILTQGAFGNYRDLLENVTYSPAMSVYLTYLRNEKADPDTGRVPDENYARELLQLFTLGLVELNPDGTPVEGSGGGEIELFDNGDITELAKVFTGLSFGGSPFYTSIRQLPFEAYYTPLSGFDAFHSMEPKNFLNVSIPAGTGAQESIDLALDGIFAHPNVGPFLARQMIQRFVTSAPSPEYVARVAAAFDAGRYELPSGAGTGNGQRGDLRAVIAAILFDERARGDAARKEVTFGKLREPVVRFTHWARAFEINSADASNQSALRNTGDAQLLGQHPYASPSVFNFYRPGYIAPGTETGAANLTAPELQITNATSVVGYPNFITAYALGQAPTGNRPGPDTFVSDYADEAALAADPEALLDRLDLLLTHGTLLQETRQRITDIIEILDGGTEQGRQLRARVASILVMTSPEYIVLR